MGKTKIEWTGKNGYTWNPIVGCSHASPGCLHCYAETYAGRLAAMGIEKYQRVVERNARGMGKKEWKGEWNGKCCLELGELENPFHWKKSRVIFVSSMGDMFHENVPFEWIDKVMAIIALNPRHTFMILTKRADRMEKYFKHCQTMLIYNLMNQGIHNKDLLKWPLPNLWIGVTTESRETADLRIPLLLRIPAALRFVSIEPMLEPVEISEYLSTILKCEHCEKLTYTIEAKLRIINTGKCGYCGGKLLPFKDAGPKLDWVILGGENGHGARPMNPEWVRKVRDDCQTAGVPFFFKGWGAYMPVQPSSNGIHDTFADERDERGFLSKRHYEPKKGDKVIFPWDSESPEKNYPHNKGYWVRTSRKRKGYFKIDGVEYRQFPEEA